MKIAVLGGSFNPLHNGHAMLADTIIREYGFDKVLFVPTYNPPHKQINSKISPEHRLEMLRHFCQEEGNGHFEVDSCEMDRGGISYTSDTVQFLTEKYKSVLEGKLYFVMGEEVAAEFDKWHEPQTIARYADFIITRRFQSADAFSVQSENIKNNPTGSYKGDFSVAFDKEKFGYPCIFIENPMLPVSSTDVRVRVAGGKSFRYLVPPSIYEYINQYGLYK